MQLAINYCSVHTVSLVAMEIVYAHHLVVALDRLHFMVLIIANAVLVLVNHRYLLQLPTHDIV